MKPRFSFVERNQAIKRFSNETFDLLIVGGGITGAATARDAASRGLKVALVEKNDFASGTSSKSSKLIHGGLRYLENLELGLVFEALSERFLLLKFVPCWVRPLPFYFPVYETDPVGKFKLGIGLWLYDLLSLFRTPGFHRNLSKKKFLQKIPSLKEKGLLGGFRYFDASMWDDLLAIETLRCASLHGVALGNYIEATQPIWEEDRVAGFQLKDALGGEVFSVRAHKTILCGGPFTDQLGERFTPNWPGWLNPSKGIHLIFDLKRFPLPGAVVMTHPRDGRIAFVIPRADMGEGVVIVGTTDGPTPRDPEKTVVSKEEVEYLMDLLHQFFPTLKLKTEDILNAYVGVRPLMGATSGTAGSEGQGGKEPELQKVSREHFIGEGPGKTVWVAGGKYTTHRLMAEEIIDFTLERWKKDKVLPLPSRVGRSFTQTPINTLATRRATRSCRDRASSEGVQIPEEIFEHFGGEAWDLHEIHQKHERTSKALSDPPGFPWIEAQLRFSIRNGMVMKLEDFYFRRTALFNARRDQGLPWAESLAQVWGEELQKTPQEINQEIVALKETCQVHTQWRRGLPNPT